MQFYRAENKWGKDYNRKWYDKKMQDQCENFIQGTFPDRLNLWDRDSCFHSRKQIEIGDFLVHDLYTRLTLWKTQV